MCVHAYIQTDRHTDRQTDRQTYAGVCTCAVRVGVVVDAMEEVVSGVYDTGATMAKSLLHVLLNTAATSRRLDFQGPNAEC